MLGSLQDFLGITEILDLKYFICQKKTILTPH